MGIVVSSIFVDDQDKALDFYTKKLGFVQKSDIPWPTTEFAHQSR